MSVTTPERRVGRPPSAAVDRAIVDATREILAEEGYAGLTIEGVAARAGVGKATVYRRWPGKVELVVDVISETAAEQVPIPDTGSTRGDLVVLVRTIIDVLTTTNAGAITAAMVAECSRNPELAHAFRTGFVAVRRAAVVDLIERGVARGDLRPDVDRDLIVDLLVAPVHYRLLVTGAPLTPDLAERVVDAVLGGSAAS